MPFPDYPYAPFDHPVPGVPIGITRDICLRFDEKWVPYIFAALKSMAAKQSYSSDAERSVEEAYFAINRAMDFAECCDTTDVNQLMGECDDMGCNCLRFQDSKLQFLDCGVWKDVPGQGATGSGPVVPTQPGGGGAPPPSGGLSGIYCGALGKGEFLIPVPLSSGDTLHFSDLQGAWHDQSGLLWNCADGYAFVGGICIFQVPLGGTDPMPTALHMALVLEIDGTLYDPLQLDLDANPTVFTVPTGILNAQGILRANVADIQAIDGQVSFCFTYTNNRPNAWCLERDFTLGPGRWQPFQDSERTGAGQWAIEQGWVENQNGSVSHDWVNTGCQFLIGSACHLTRIEVTYDLTLGTTDSPTERGAWIELDGAVVFSILWNQLTTGDNQTMAIGLDNDVTSKISAYVGASSVTPPGYDGGNCSIKRIRICGTGVPLEF